jgi:hypothetical protein
MALHQASKELQKEALDLLDSVGLKIDLLQIQESPPF